MYNYEDIQSVHLEITNRCNANCPQCPRTINGGLLNKSLTLTELYLSDIQKILPPEFVAQLYNLFMCGNFGDAIVARDTLPVFQYLRDCNPDIELTLHTNASARTPEWWKQLAAVFEHPNPELKGSIWCGLDGLADTNHIYRRNTDWNIIMRNVTAFIEAGGDAEWIFIPFKHNQHQVEEAEALSQKMGFKRFVIRRTARFLDGTTGKPLTRTPIRDKDNTTIGYLEFTTDPSYQNMAVAQPDFDHYLRTTPISCKVQQDKSIFIAADGMAHPCCWVGAAQCDKHGSETQVNKLLQTVDVNAKTRPLRDIVETHFANFPQYWKADDKRLCRPCSRYCGGDGSFKSRNKDLVSCEHLRKL